MWSSEANQSGIGGLPGQRSGVSHSSAGLEPLDVPLELLVPPLGFVSAALGVPQGDLQRGHTPVVLGQGRLELRHFGSQLRVLLLQPARHT